MRTTLTSRMLRRSACSLTANTSPEVKRITESDRGCGSVISADEVVMQTRLSIVCSHAI